MIVLLVHFQDNAVIVVSMSSIVISVIGFLSFYYVFFHIQVAFNYVLILKRFINP